MSGKKIKIAPKPNSTKVEKDIEDWVSTRSTNEENIVTETQQEKTKRLTIDIPESLHMAIKSACALRGTKIADEVRALLKQKYID
ncbi:plasmid partition protein ParG [Providencia rettgeri]